jgi:hypothetical protein
MRQRVSSHISSHLSLNMAKKAGRTILEPTGATPVLSRDALQRLSYLYQASVLLSNAGLDLSPSRPHKRQRTSSGGTQEVGVKLGPSSRPVSEAGRVVDREPDQGRDNCNPGHPRAPTAPTHTGEIRKRPEDSTARPRRTSAKTLHPVSQHLVRTMQEVAKKATVRM